jgi:predicted dehydrogenase
VTDRVKIGVVGYGYWGPNLVRNIFELPGAEVAYVCDLRPSALDKAVTRYPGVRTTQRLEEILSDPDVDAVAIATPLASHYSLARTGLDAGKHVFVEKPLAASIRDAVQLSDMAEARELVLMPGHTFLYSPPVNIIADMIRAGELGEIYSISTSRVNLGLHQPDASVVWDLGPHDFSILRFWLDETPTHVSAISRGCIMPDTADVAFIHLVFPSGTVAHVELSWLAPSKLRRTTIIGSRKMVVYDDTSTEPVRVFDSGAMLDDPASFGEFRLSYRTGDIISPRVEAGEPLQLELEDFCRSITTGSKPRSSPQLGIEVVRMIEAVEASLASGGRPEQLASVLTDVLAGAAVTSAKAARPEGRL